MLEGRRQSHTLNDRRLKAVTGVLEVMMRAKEDVCHVRSNGEAIKERYVSV